MHESRMIAEVVPPGDCAIEKVSGRRIATPLAPPSPGSTPMMTPSTMPTNISARFLKLSATTKPCSSDWISSINARPSAHAQQVLERPFRQRHLEPDLEDQEKDHAVADADDGHLPPRILPQPAHEKSDVQRGGEVDPGPADERDVDRRRHEHRRDELELAELDEGPVFRARAEPREHQVDRRGGTDDEADVAREITRLRPVVGPARAEAHAVPNRDRAQQEKERRDDHLGAPVAEGGPLLALGAHYFLSWRKPALFMSATCRCSSFATQSAYALPSSEVVLKAPCSIRFFHSGVCWTFFSTST